MELQTSHGQTADAAAVYWVLAIAVLNEHEYHRLHSDTAILSSACSRNESISASSAVATPT